MLTSYPDGEAERQILMSMEEATHHVCYQGRTMTTKFWCPTCLGWGIVEFLRFSRKDIEVLRNCRKNKPCAFAVFCMASNGKWEVMMSYCPTCKATEIKSTPVIPSTT